MNTINRFLLTYVLRRVTSRACPATITRGTSGSARLNCFYAWMLKDGEHDFVVLEVIGDEAHGLRYNDDRSSTEVRVPLSQMDPELLQVTHIYGNDEVRYDGAWAVVRGLWTGWPYAFLHARRLWEAVSQWAFNRRALPSRRRLELLRELTSFAEKTDECVSSLDLMSARHGNRWAGHPQWYSHHARLDGQLDLLVEAGDLRKCDGGFRPTGQGLKTLEDADEADRRHRENVRVQWGLVVLAIASVIMAAAQAGLVRFPVLIDMTGQKPPSPAATPGHSAAQLHPPASAASSATAPSIKAK